MQDYYAILGLDRSASPEFVKLAYRRLARQFHPDMLAASSTESDKALVHTHMAMLNEAYAVLSNSKARREYDEQLKLEVVLASKTTTTRGEAAAAREPRGDHTPAPASKAAYGRIRPRHDVDSTVIGQFAGHLRESFVHKKSGFSWSSVAFEGFDWGLESLSWSACYYVALRGFASLDAAAAKKFVNYSEMVVTGNKRAIRRNHFLFLLPFVQMVEWETVSRQIQLFLNGKSSAAVSPASVSIMLLDMSHARTLRLGSRSSDKRFEELIQSIRTKA